MSGDYSRLSYDPRRHFAAVLAEQGRVQTDADWNEWAAAMLRRAQADSLDTLGPAVVPRETPDGFLIQAAGGTLTIGRGRIYVDGLLAENHGEPPLEWYPRLAELRGTGATPYTAQPYLPNTPSTALPTGAGPHVAYLKVWQREVTSVEEPKLIEPALGVDTTTRLQTVWQVRVLPNVGQGVTCQTALEDVPGFGAAEPAAAGRLSTGTATVPGVTNPCLVPPSGGYQGLENQLYRVEIHDAGGLTGQNRATFKWSRDNATVASRVTSIPTLDQLVVESVGRDSLLRFSEGDWIEITDDWRELTGLPGVMRRIRTNNGVDDAMRTILLENPLPAGMFPVDAKSETAPGRNTRVRRWDQHGRVLDAGGTQLVNLDDANANGTIPVQPATTSIVLENGVVVNFNLDPASGRFRSGDYWVFAARTANASVEVLNQAPPRGIHAHYAKLAIVSFPDSENDCRTLWPPEMEGGGCDCTVCVSPESHTSGALTIQMAVEQVKQAGGGTVCLDVGTYPLRETLRIEDAKSLRVKGQGTATVLFALAGGQAVEVRSGDDVRIESLTVVTVPKGDFAEAVTLRNSSRVTLRDCTVSNITVGDRLSFAVALDGYLLDVAVERCVLTASVGISGGLRDGSYLLTRSLRVVDNWLWCLEQGVALERFCIHLADTHLADNTVHGGRNAGLVAVGGTVAAGAFSVVGNLCMVEGSGIVVGLDAARIADNDVRKQGERFGDGIALVAGLDPSGIDHCQVLGNRIRGVQGHGIVIRTLVNSGMIKHNIVDGVGGGGIVMEDEGRAGELVVENNQLLDVAGAPNDQGAHAVAMRIVDVQDLDVRTNVIHNFARDVVQATARAAIRVVATPSARIAANRLTGIGSTTFAGDGVAVEVLSPFSTVGILDNVLHRRGAADDNLKNVQWVGIQVSGLPVSTTAPGQFVALGDVAVVFGPQRALMLTATRVSHVAISGRGDVTADGNEILAESSSGSPVKVEPVETCQLSGNRIVTENQEAKPSLVGCQRGAVVANNELRSFRGVTTLEVVVPLTPDPTGGEQAVPAAAILGNLRTGGILVNKKPLGNPWLPLNPLIQ